MVDFRIELAFIFLSNSKKDERIAAEYGGVLSRRKFRKEFSLFEKDLLMNSIREDSEWHVCTSIAEVLSPREFLATWKANDLSKIDRHRARLGSGGVAKGQFDRAGVPIDLERAEAQFH